MSRKCDLLLVGVQVGNKVSHSNRKTKTRFLPNLRAVCLESESLGCNLSFRVAASTLRTINKYGSIDQFLLGFKYAKLSPLAKRYRAKIKKKVSLVSESSEKTASA